MHQNIWWPRLIDQRLAQTEVRRRAWQKKVFVGDTLSTIQRFHQSSELLRRQEYKRTTSSSSAVAFPLRVLSVATALVSVDEMARLASSPMGTASSGYWSISDSTRVLGESGASPEPDDAGRAWTCCCDACSSSDSSD
jgi:hypothetical protein